MRNLLKGFMTAEDGNAVIDWVVLLASSVLLALVVVVTVTENAETITSDKSERMTSVAVNPAI